MCAVCDDVSMMRTRDRLTHRAEIISIEGESYRKREAEQAQKRKQEQKPKR